MLYQCALDAQIQGKKELGFTVLKKILRHYNDDFMTDEAKKELRLPVLFRYLSCAGEGVDFRCVIRFTFAETDQGKTSDVHIITVLCAEFEAGIISRWRMTLMG